MSDYEPREKILKPEGFTPSELWPSGHPHTGKPRCQAWNANHGRQCLRVATPSFRVCRNHGGKSLVGPAHPNWKNGRHSKMLPENLMEMYEQSMADADQLSLSPELALLDARINDLLDQLEENPLSPSLFSDIARAWRDLTAAVRRQDRSRQNELYALMNKLLDENMAAFSVWEDIYKALEQRRKLADSERKRITAAQQSISADQAMVLVTNIIGLVRDHVQDRDTLAKISTGVRQLMGEVK